jgi:hypothetical protein
VLIDEVHAYLVAPAGSFSAAQETLAPLQKNLRAIFARHAGQLSGAGAAVSRA